MFHTRLPRRLGAGERREVAEERTCNDRGALFRQRGVLFRALTARGYQLRVAVAAPRCRGTARRPPERSHLRAPDSCPRPEPGGGRAGRPPPCGPEAAGQRQVPARRVWASAVGSFPQERLVERRDRGGGASAVPLPPSPGRLVAGGRAGGAWRCPCAPLRRARGGGTKGI